MNGNCVVEKYNKQNFTTVLNRRFNLVREKYSQT